MPQVQTELTKVTGKKKVHVTKIRFQEVKKRTKAIRDFNANAKSFEIAQTLGVAKSTFDRIDKASTYAEYKELLKQLNPHSYTKKSTKKVQQPQTAKALVITVTQADLDAQAAMILSGVQDMLDEALNKKRTLFGR